MSACRVTSQRTNSALPPSAVMARAASSPASTATSESKSFAPSRDAATAVARPMPEAAPVMRIALPSSRPAMFSSLASWFVVGDPYENRVATLNPRTGGANGSFRDDGPLKVAGASAMDGPMPDAERVKDVLAREKAGGEVAVRGWLKTARHSKGL